MIGLAEAVLVTETSEVVVTVVVTTWLVLLLGLKSVCWLLSVPVALFVIEAVSLGFTLTTSWKVALSFFAREPIVAWAALELTDQLADPEVLANEEKVVLAGMLSVRA